jgi:NAD(P)-dependent dehydrogenase (short-subunit alcohol dehydrogenase family)
MTGRLEGRVALVTGGASGIGEGTVRRFVEEGARCLVVDLQDDRGRALCAELGDATAYQRADVGREDDVAAAVAAAVAAFGRLDIMFNNAGILGAIGPIAEIDGSAWQRSIDVLLSSVFYGIKHAAQVMIPQGSGVILNTASTAGVRAGLGPHVYTAAKHGVVGLTQSVATELGRHGIRANVIAPGGTVSGLTAKLVTGDADATDAAAKLIGSRGPLGRAGQPLDIANAALYLASDEASYVTGHVLVVDGAGEVIGDRNHRFVEMGSQLEQGRAVAGA